MANNHANVIGSIHKLMTKPLGGVFKGESWHTWRTLLRACFEGMDVLNDDERALVHQLTGRSRLPSKLSELWIVAGRRSGKSIIAALIAVWATCCRSYPSLVPGEVGVFMIIASDKRQARVIKRYVLGLLRAHPSLEAMIARETREAIWLTNGLCIEIHTCSFKSVRGFTLIGAALDETAFWDSEDSASPDHEVLIALRAATATVPEALIVGISSPYARRGELWRVYDKHFGQDDSDRVLVVNAATRTLNPSVDQAFIDQAYEDDPVAAEAEFGGQWRRDVEAFLPFDVLQAARMNDRLEVPPVRGVQYVAFADPSGGTGGDSFTLAIAHVENNGRVVLDCLREVRPPFSPEGAVATFADTLRTYGVRTVMGDRYAGAWPAEAISKHGIRYDASERTKSDIYIECLPLFTTGRVELLDHPRLVKQFGALERKTARSGKDSIDHPPRQHDDLCNAASGALVSASLPPFIPAACERVEWLL